MVGGARTECAWNKQQDASKYKTSERMTKKKDAKKNCIAFLSSGEIVVQSLTAMSADGAPGVSAPTSFECNICLETAHEPVVTFCGHLFCWACLFRWMRGDHHACPVCKSGISRETVIPLYGRGDDATRSRAQAAAATAAAAARDADAAPAAGSAAGAEDVPGRPRAQRTATGDAGDAAGHHQPMPGLDARGFFGPGARPGNPWDPYGPYAGNNFAFAAGFGFFPSLFGLQFQTFGLGGAAEREMREDGRAPTVEEQHQLLLSRVLLSICLLVVAMLLFL